jgi:hypothetical protein
MGAVIYRWFLLIAEPRVQRLVQFVVYLLLGCGGFLIIATPPSKFQNVLGFGLVLAFGIFVLVGAIFGAIGVLPGIRWLERAGILALFVGLAIFMVLVIALHGTPISFIFGAVLALMFVVRFLQIRKFALTPKLG